MWRGGHTGEGKKLSWVFYLLFLVLISEILSVDYGRQRLGGRGQGIV